jgi:hypothetical protein
MVCMFGGVCVLVKKVLLPGVIRIFTYDFYFFQKLYCFTFSLLDCLYYWKLFSDPEGNKADYSTKHRIWATL